jgi:hypothetical protein
MALLLRRREVSYSERNLSCISDALLRTIYSADGRAGCLALRDVAEKGSVEVFSARILYRMSRSQAIPKADGQKKFANTPFLAIIVDARFGYFRKELSRFASLWFR